MRRPFIWVWVGLPVAGAVAFVIGWSSGGVTESPAELQQSGAELDHQLTVLRGQMAHKQWVTDEVIAGRMELGEAIKWFRRIDGDRGGDDYATGRSVIAWVNTSLLESPGRAEELSARLSIELERSFAAGPGRSPAGAVSPPARPA